MGNTGRDLVAGTSVVGNNSRLMHGAMKVMPLGSC